MTSKFFAEGNLSDQQDNNSEKSGEENNRNQPSYQYDFLDERWNNKKREVKTEKEKKWNIIKDYTKKIDGGLNNQDFEKVWALLQDLLRQIEKSNKLIEKEGYPPFFLKCLKRVHDQVLQFSKDSEAKKKLKKHSLVAFNTMNQKLKKLYVDFEKDIEQFIQMGEEEEEEELDESSSSSSESDPDDIALLESDDPMVRRRYWLKKKQDKKEDKKDEKKEEEKKEKKEKDEDKEEKPVKKEFKVHQKKKAAEIQSIKDAENRMKEIRKNFAKLHTQEEREEYLFTLDKISEKTKEAKDFEKLSFYLLDIPIRIDVSRQMKLTHFPRAQWLKLYTTVKQIYQLLRESEEDDMVENIRLFDEGNTKNQAVSRVTEEAIYISLKTYLILIESQIKKALIFVSSNEHEYYERLQDLIGLCDLMYKISKELQIKDGYEKEAAELAFKVLQNAYFMDKALIERIKNEMKVDISFLELANEETIREYSNLILRYQSDEETKTKTLLYVIYNHAINGREKGKELLTVSTISQTITSYDYYTQVLYNRVLAQIGLMAFRQGNIFEVQQFLYEMCSMTKAKENTKDVLKEFLAQGYSRFLNEKQIPKSKVLPVYLHINTEIIECVELIASMLLETPYILTEGGRITSKTFKRFTYEYERSFFIKENFNNRDLIFTAGSALKEGNWEGCYNQLEQLNIWKYLPDADLTKENLLRVVKEQSLKCYLIGNRKCFKSIALSSLAEKFTLDEKAIRKYICKLISEKILQGSINRAGYLIFFQKKQSEMQKICESLFEKVKEMNNANEQWLNQKFTPAEDSDEEKDEAIATRRSNLAINEKLKAILSKRNEKY